MSEFSGLLPSKPRGRLGRRNPTTDSVFGLVAGGVAVVAATGVAGIALGQVVKLTQPEDATALGINAAYDANNSVLVYHHIQRYFTYNPDGTLFLKLVAKGTTLAAMCGAAGAVQQLLTDADVAGSIRKVGLVLNPTTAPQASDFTTGLLTDVLNAVPLAQALVTALATQAIYVDNIMLEGILSSTATVTNLPSLRALASDSVSVCIAADPATLTATGGKAYAAIGSALGMLSVRKVSESLGSVDIARKPDSAKGTTTYPLTNRALGYFLKSALSNGVAFASLSDTDKTTLGTKGYIYAGSFQGFDGVYFNDSHTCIEASDDYAYIEDNGVWNKAVRLLRVGMMPVIRGEVEVDASTGYMTASTVEYYKAKGVKAVRPMSVAKEISGEPIVDIAPNQDVVGTSTVSMSVSYVRQAVLRKLEAEVGAVNPAAS
jgi:hypothetical protein